MVCGLLIATNLIIYAQTIRHDFINLDDDVYVVGNRILHDGMSARMIQWAFTTFHAANWHPLTWISHALDFEMFGLWAGGHHLTNVLLHCVNSLLTFVVFHRLTNEMWRSAAVAALFAVHPLHVESVAWVAERKDVLSTMFWLLTMFFYALYVKDGEKRKWLWLTIVMLGLGLMAKSMLVTLPFALLLLDYWPLGRLKWQPSEGIAKLRAEILPLVREKLPLFALAIAAAVVTFVAQKSGGAVQQLENLPSGNRISNTVAAYLSYLVAFFWPFNLGVYYPLQIGGRPPWQVVAALVVLTSISFFVWRTGRTRRYLLFGWLWFLGTLVPVIGLIQVGGQSMADRYTYVPYFGLFVIVVWGAAELFARLNLPTTAAGALIAAVLIVFTFTSWQQVKRWRDSKTLFEHTLAVTENNLLMEYKLGVVFGREGRPQDAEAHFAKALSIWPGFYEALLNMGVALTAQRRWEEAATFYDRALRVRPTSVEVLVNKASALAQQGKFDNALPVLEQALRIDPNNADAHTNLGLVFLRQGKAAEAMPHLEQATVLNPNSAEAHNNLGLALLMQRNNAAAIQAFQRALSINPNYATAQANLRRAQAGAGSMK